MTSPAGTSHPDLDARAVTLMVTCCTIWGVGIVMAKISNLGISPVLNAGLRSVVAGILIWSWATARGIRLYDRDGTLTAGILSGTLFAFEFLAIYMGLARTSAARATLFIHAAPFVAAAGEHFLGHRLTLARALGLVVAFVGLAVAFGEALMGHAPGDLTGDLYCLIGGVLWGATTIVVKGSALRRAPAEKTLLYQLGASALLLPPLAYAMGEAGVTDWGPRIIGAFLYTALAVVSFGYLTWFWLMRTYSAASLHAFTFLTPILGVVAGSVLLGEKLTIGLLVGLSLVAFGIWLVNRPARRP